MKQTIEATVLALPVCASLFTGFGRGVVCGGQAVLSVPTVEIAHPAAFAAMALQQQTPADVTWDLPNLDHKRVDDWVARYTGDLHSSFAGENNS